MDANVDIDMYTALLGGEILIQLGNGSKLKLKVKPETQTGTKVRLRGKGYSRADGTSGDLIITYNVASHQPFGTAERTFERNAKVITGRCQPKRAMACHAIV